MSEAKRKGTAAESAVVSFLRTQGWPYAERLALQGAHDRGDVTGTPGICWEVKNCADLDLPGWLAEAAVERENAHADHGIVVAKPVGIGIKSVEHWYAAMYAGDLHVLLAQAGVEPSAIWVHRMPSGYKRGLRSAMLNVGDLADMAERQFGVVEIVAKGVKDGHRWYNVMTLGQMTRLLKRAGYGDDRS
jgi:hypothetical protein